MLNVIARDCSLFRLELVIFQFNIKHAYLETGTLVPTAYEIMTIVLIAVLLIDTSREKMFLSLLHTACLKVWDKD